MALRATMNWEVRNVADFADASDLNGGGFDSSETGGTDYSHASVAAAGGPHVIFDGTDVKWTIAAAGLTIKIYGYTVEETDVGNVLNVTGGTNATAGRYVIDSVTTGSEGTQAWTLIGPSNISTGEVTDGQGRMGGCLASPGTGAAAATISGNLIWIRYSSTAYALTTATPGSGGPVLFNTAIKVKMEGYETTRGDLGQRPTLDAAGTAGTYYLFSTQGAASQSFVNLIADGSKTASANVGGFINNANRNGMIYRCKAFDCDQASCYGFWIHRGCAVECEADNCTVGFYQYDTGVALYCLARLCGTGFLLNVGPCVKCIAYQCTGPGFDLSSYGAVLCDCTADDCGGDGFDATTYGMTCVNCYAGGNGGHGYDNTNVGGTSYTLQLIKSGGGIGSDENANSSGNVSDTTFLAAENQIGFVSVTDGSPFVSASDWSPNNTALRGKLLQNAGCDIATQADYQNIGAVQHSPDYPDAGNVWDDTVNGVDGTLIVPGRATSNVTLSKESGAAARGGSGTCAKLLPASTSVYGYWYWYVPVTASTAFTMTFWYNCTSGFDGEIKVTIYDTDQSTALDSSRDVGETADGDWHQYAGYEVTPTATGLCLVRVEVKQGAHSAEDLIYIDDIAVV